MRNSALLCRRGLLWIALRLDILTKILRKILNKHLCPLCGPWMFLGLLRKMFWSSEDRVRARFHYAESRQNKPQVNL